MYQFNIISTKEIEEDAKLFSHIKESCSLLLIRKDSFDIEEQDDIDFICRLLSRFEYEVSTESTFFILTKDIAEIKKAFSIAKIGFDPNMILD